MAKASTAKQNAEDRAQIREADPVRMLIDVARGMPIPRRDIDGEIVAYDQVDAPVRVAAMERLLKRVLPELQSVSIEAAGEGVQFVINSPFPLPGSQRPGLEQDEDGPADGPAQVEGHAMLDALSNGLRRLQAHEHAEPAPEPSAASNRRTRRPGRSRPKPNINQKGQTQ